MIDGDATQNGKSDALTTSADELLAVRGVSKRFGATQALQDASLEIRRGEIHGLVGANGSGKSSLVKIIAGIYEPDAGEAWLRGQPRSLPLSAEDRRGLATIHQDLGMVDGLSSLENMIVTTNFGARKAMPIQWKARAREARKLLETMNLDIDLESDVATLAPGQRTLLAVCRAMLELIAARDADADADTDTDADGADHLIFLDEPTAALSDAESVAVWQLLRRICARGGSALLVSHHLNEIVKHCDRVTVMRDGRRILTKPCDQVTEASLVQAMLGPAAPTAERRPEDRAIRTGGIAVPLRARRLRGHKVRDVSFEIAAGEVLGVVGLAGMGQDELPYLVAGALPLVGGNVEVGGHLLRSGDLVGARREGVALVPQDRLRDGLWTEADGAENLGIVDGRRFVQRARYRRRLEVMSAQRWFERLDVRPSAPTLPLAGFSGGNQQKVLIAKWLQTEPSVILLHEPTQGVDVGAKREIHRILRAHSQVSGAAVCLCSTDLEEIEEMSDRVIVLRYGRIAGELVGDAIRADAMLGLANGS